MNILIPDKWLREHLKTTATPKQIQKYLSLSGPTVERIKKIKDDSVYDVEITTNRVDSMSVRGIAREAAAILPEFGLKAKLKPLKLPEISSLKPLDFTIKNNPRLCHRVLAVKLENVQVKKSPPWLVTRLEQVDQRALNNIVDITNYVMWEIGHPIHAFDYDRLSHKTIIVRAAKPGETLVTLDDKKHLLRGGEIVFDNGTGTIIDLPGIMGTKNTVVTQNTKNVLLLIESSDPVKIRQASMGLAIRSQAAILNEKNVDPELALPTLLKGVELYQKLAQAKIGSRLVDIYPQKALPKPVILKQSQLDTYLGLQVAPNRVKRILENLGCTVTAKGSVYRVTPPSWRAKDLQISQDIIEEVARIYGYHNLPSVIMDTPIPDNPPEENFKLEHRLKTWLAGMGLTEIYSYSMVSEKLALRSGFKLSDHLKLKNPLTDDWVYMRRSLIPSLIQAVQDNQRNKISLFEMQNVYLASPKRSREGGSLLPNEELRLSLITTQSYSYLKGIADSLLERLHLNGIQIIPTQSAPQTFSPQATAEIRAGKTLLGHIGNVKNAPYYAADILVKPLLQLSSSHPRYIPLVTTPPIIEDLTFTLPEKTYLGEVIDEIYATSKFVESVQLINTYQQNYSFTITYRDPQKSLTDKRIAPIRKRVVANLKKSFSAQLKGEL